MLQLQNLGSAIQAPAQAPEKTAKGKLLTEKSCICQANGIIFAGAILQQNKISFLMIIRNPLLTNASGSMANMTFVGIQDGAVIAKGKIVNMTNPNTEGQQATRNVFTLLVAAFKVMKPVLNYLNIPSTARRSPFNQFMANNIAPLKEQLGDSDFSEENQMILALKEQLGDDSTTPVAEVTSVNTTQPTFTAGVAELDVEWVNNTDNPNALGTDELWFLEYDAGDQYYNLTNSGGTRADEAYQMEIRRPSKGYKVYYFYWKRAASASYSACYGIVAVPVTGNVQFIQTAVIS